MFLKRHEISMSCESNMRTKFVVPLDQKVAHKSYDHFGTPFVSLSLPKLELYGLAWPYPYARKYTIYYDRTPKCSVHWEMQYILNLTKVFWYGKFNGHTIKDIKSLFYCQTWWPFILTLPFGVFGGDGQQLSYSNFLWNTSDLYIVWEIVWELVILTLLIGWWWFCHP